MWPNARDLLAQAGSLTTTTKVFPKTEVMGHSFQSFTANEYCQLVKQYKSSMAYVLGMVK